MFNLGVIASGRRLWTPAEITTSMWFNDESIGAIVATDKITTWNDLSGNDRFGQSDSSDAARPSLVTAGLNGRDIVRFNGTDNRFFFSANGAQGVMRNIGYGWCAAVFKVDAFGSSEPVMWFARGTTTASRFVLQVNSAGPHEVGGRRLDGNGFASVSSAASTDTNWHIVIGANDYTNGFARLWVDGGAEQSANVSATWGTGNTSNTDSTGVAMGAFSSGAEWFNGDIAEVIIHNAVLTSGNRQRIEGYLAHRWGLTSLLPVDHPYKTTAPAL